MTKINSKQCTKCQEVKPLVEFGKHKSGKDGIRANCKPCERATNNARRKAKAIPKEILPENHKRCTKCAEVKGFDEFYKKDSGKHGLNANCKTCFNKTTMTAYEKSAGSLALKARRAVSNANVEAKKYGVPGKLTAADVREVLSGDKCSYCAKTLEQSEKSIDHLLAMIEGGANTKENLVLACIPCNKEKRNRPAYDFIMKQSNSDATRLLLATLSERQDVAPIQALRLLERQQTAYSERLFRAKHYGESAQ